MSPSNPGMSTTTANLRNKTATAKKIKTSEDALIESVDWAYGFMTASYVDPALSEEEQASQLEAAQQELGEFRSGLTSCFKQIIKIAKAEGKAEATKADATKPKTTTSSPADKIEITKLKAEIVALKAQLATASSGGTKNVNANAKLMNVCSATGLTRSGHTKVRVKALEHCRFAANSNPGAAYAAMCNEGNAPPEECTLGELVAHIKAYIESGNQILRIATCIAACLEEESLKQVLTFFDASTTKSASGAKAKAKTNSGGERAINPYTQAGSDMSNAVKGKPYNHNIDVLFELTEPTATAGTMPSGYSKWEELKDEIGELGTVVHPIGLYHFLVNTHKFSHAAAAGLVWSMGLARVIAGTLQPVDNGVTWAIGQPWKRDHSPKPSKPKVSLSKKNADTHKPKLTARTPAKKTPEPEPESEPEQEPEQEQEPEPEQEQDEMKVDEPEHQPQPEPEQPKKKVTLSAKAKPKQPEPEPETEDDLDADADDAEEDDE